MILTMPKLAEVLDTAGRQYIADYRETPGACAAGFLMMSYILQAMNVKTREEALAVAMDRLIEQRPALDLLNGDDRNMLSLILKQMFAPLGVANLLIVGVTGEGKTYVTHFTDKAPDLASVQEVKNLMRAIIADDGAEEFNL